MPKVTEAHRTARRDEILHAAQRVFARGGYRGSSITEVIKESGLSAGAIYSYFSSKEELFQAVVERTFAARTSVITETHPAHARSPAELIRSLIDDMGEPSLTISPLVWAEAAVEPETRSAVARVFEQLGELLRTELTEWASAHPERVEGDPAAWAARLTPVLVALIPGFIVQRMVVADFNDQAFLDALGEAFDR